MSNLKKWMALLLVLVISMGLFGCGADPNAIAVVANGKDKTYVKTVEELAAAIDPSGNSRVTLCKDISLTQTVNLPYSCVIEFAGHTLQTDPQRGVGIIIEAAGSENPVTVLSNGTLKSYSDSVRVKGGGLALSRMNVYTEYGNCICFHDPEAGQDNKIQDSVLLSAAYGCFSFNETDMDFSKVRVVIEGTKLIAADKNGAEVFHSAGSTTVSGVVTLGGGVEIYTYGNAPASGGVTFNGSGLARTENAQVSALEITCQDINCWSADTADQVIDVLMIGNSFCYNYTPELHGMAASVGIQLNLQNLYYGGRSVKAHWERIQSGQADYDQYWITNDFGRFQQPDNLEIGRAIAYADWDVITLQQHFDVERTVDYETALASCDPYAKNIYDHLKQTCPDAKLYWHETWAYGIGYPTNDNGKMPVDSVAVQTRQQNQIRAVSKTLCEQNGVDMIPSGDAWAIARANPLIGDTLTKADKCHDGDVGGGQYLNACVWFEVLTGKSCVGNTYRPDDYTLPEEKVAALQNAAHQAVAAVYGADYAK